MLDRHFGAKFVAIAPVYYSNLAGVVLGREGLADRNLCFRTQLTELSLRRGRRSTHKFMFLPMLGLTGTKSRSVLIYFERLKWFYAAMLCGPAGVGQQHSGVLRRSGISQRNTPSGP
jgi:hypothetical protein